MHSLSQKYLTQKQTCLSPTKSLLTATMDAQASVEGRKQVLTCQRKVCGARVQVGIKHGAECGTFSEGPKHGAEERKWFACEQQVLPLSRQQPAADFLQSQAQRRSHLSEAHCHGRAPGMTTQVRSRTELWDGAQWGTALMKGSTHYSATCPSQLTATSRRLKHEHDV